jgi:hypothetical protein
MHDPYRTPRAATPPDGERGSLLGGFLFGWLASVGAGAVAVAGYVGLFMLDPQGGLLYGIPFLALALLPFLALVALLTLYAVRGKTRSALGVLLAFLSQIAAVVLLVAACFGLVISSYQ